MGGAIEDRYRGSPHSALCGVTTLPATIGHTIAHLHSGNSVEPVPKIGRGMVLGEVLTRTDFQSASWSKTAPRHTSVPVGSGSLTGSTPSTNHPGPSATRVTATLSPLA